MPSATEVQTKVDKFVVNMDRADLLVNGDAETDVSIDGGGTIPTFAKMHAAAALEVSGAATAKTGAETARDLARNYAISDTDAPISGALSSSDRGAKFYADRAQVSNLAAQAAAAGVATGAGQYLIIDGPPANNVGSVGAFAFDSSASLLYGPKTTAGWGAGRAVSPAITLDRTRYEFRYGATFPTALFTPNRASVSTDFMYFDDPSYGPGTTFANNVPVLRADLGFGVFQQSRQFLTTTANPPSTQTTSASVAVGPCVLIAWGPAGSTATATPGTATFSATPPALAADGRSFQVINVTVAGTITVACAGGVQFINLQQNPLLPSITQPVPYIAGATTRSPDLPVATAAGRALFGTAGSFIAQTHRVSPMGYGNGPAILGLNGTSALYASAVPTGQQPALGTHSVTIYDPANHTQSVSTGGRDWATQTVRAGFTWDAAATVTFGAGNRFEASFPYAFNNGAAVTQAYLGCGKNTSYGDQALNGFIQFFEVGTTRLSTDAFYAAYTQFAAPVLDDRLKNYKGTEQFRKFIAAYQQLKAGVRDHLSIAIVGPSHEAGTGTGTNQRLNGWPPQLASILEAAGIPATDDFFAGTNGAPFAGGTNPHDGRLGFSGGTPTLAGVNFGGEVIVIPAGGKLTFSPTRQNAKFLIGLFTAPSGYGSARISTDGGVTPLVPVEGGSSTISTTAAAGLMQRSFTASLGSNSWTIEAVGAPLHISFGYAFNPALKQLVIMNGGRNGFTVATMANASTVPEQGYLYPLTVLKPALLIGCSDMTNDMASGGTAWLSYYTDLSTILSSSLAQGDVLMFTDPPSRSGAVVPSDGFAGYAVDLQARIYRYALAVAFEKGVPVYDFFGWKPGDGYAALFLPGYYATDPIHMAQRGQREGKAKPVAQFIQRLIGFAA